MIDEYGNEITENKFEKIKRSLWERRYLVVFLFAVFFITIVVIQAILSLMSSRNKKQNTNNNNLIPTVASPKSFKKINEIATDSGFINLESQVASLSAEIDATDLYENSLIFPPVKTTVKIEEK